jgi:hypothetical protein
MNEDDESPIIGNSQARLEDQIYVGSRGDSDLILDPEAIQADDIRRAEYIDQFICGSLD